MGSPSKMLQTLIQSLLLISLISFEVNGRQYLIKTKDNFDKKSNQKEIDTLHFKPWHINSQKNRGETKTDRIGTTGNDYNIVDFGLFLNLLTGCGTLSNFKLSNHGSFCGLGGKGEPVDDLDKCCQTHDKCYGKKPESCGKKHGTLVSYEWKKEGDTAICLNSTNTCPRHVCECDKAMGICIKEGLDNGNLKCPEKFDLFEDGISLMKRMIRGF